MNRELGSGGQRDSICTPHKDLGKEPYGWAPVQAGACRGIVMQNALSCQGEDPVFNLVVSLGPRG